MEVEQATTQEVFEPTVGDMIQTENGIPTTTSPVIAQMFEKRHKDVLRVIHSMECSPGSNECSFAPVGYKDAKGGIRPTYRLTRDSFALLAVGFTGKKTAAWKERFLKAFNVIGAALLRQRQQQEAAPKEPEQSPPPRTWEKPGFFRSARKLTKAQTGSLLGVLNMECPLQSRQPEDVLKELLTFFRLPSLEDMYQPDYRHAVLSMIRRVLLISGKISENTQTSSRYAATISGLVNFWNHSSDSTKSNVQNYVRNKCDRSLQEGISSDSDGLKVLFTLWGGISHYNLWLN